MDTDIDTTLSVNVQSQAHKVNGILIFFELLIFLAQF